jgi:hypothetical protein
MKKYAGVLTGAAVTLIGIAALALWRSEFATVLKGTIPVLFIFGGVVAVIAGLSEIKDITASEKK